MKNKIFGLFALSILTLVLFAGLTSAVTLAEWPLTSDGVAINVNSDVTAGTFTSSGVTDFSFHVDNGAFAEDWPIINSVDTTKYFEVTISPQSSSTLTISDINFDYSASIAGPASFEAKYSTQSSFGSPTSLVIKTDVDNVGTAETSSNSGLSISVNSGDTLTLRWFGYDFDADTNEFHVKNLNIQGTTTTVDPQEIQDCSTIGNPGELEIKDIDFSNEGLSSATFGDDDEWFPFEEIEVEIDIKNKGNYDVDDVEVSWGLYDVNAGEWAIDFDEEDEFNVKDGDTETFTISFKLDDDLDVDLEDLSDDNDNYRLYVVADGTIDDNDSPNDGKDTCAFDYEPAAMIIESDFVILDNIQIPDVVQCNAKAQIKADVWNIGEDSQDDVTIIIYNQELGINEEFIIDEVDEFDKEQLDLTFEIPEDAKEKTYTLKFTIYDEDHDVYENDYDDDRSIFSVFFKVEGNCGAVGSSEVLISANLESEAKAGKDLVIKATITNNEDELETFTVNAAGFAQWASSYTVDRSNIILNAGESADVLFTFDVNKDASGSQGFTIELVSGDNQITTQPVSVVIEGRSGLFGLTGAVTSGNAYLWGIGFLNIVLIIIIILVAVRIARRK